LDSIESDHPNRTNPTTHQHKLSEQSLKSSSLALQGMHEVEALLPEQTCLNGRALAQEDVDD
jgi:hypothetical protein